jgi:ABC-type branched-subunit amino acid transport system permease subunit
MTPDKIIRMTLWTSVPFNFVAAYSFAFPASFSGQMMGLPFEAPAVYSVLLAWLVALFGAVYGWLAMQTKIDRPIVTMAAIGKVGVFVLAALLWLSGQVQGKTVFVVSGDLIFGCVFFWWLVKTAKYANK